MRKVWLTLRAIGHIYYESTDTAKTFHVWFLVAAGVFYILAGILPSPSPFEYMDCWLQGIATFLVCWALLDLGISFYKSKKS